MDSQILSLLKSPGFKSSPISGSSDFPIHENILSKSPPGTNILSVQRVGISLWTITGKLSIQSPDIPPNHYFLKLAASSTGKLMLEGEFASMTALHTSLPTFIPKPHSSGSFTIDKTPIYFMLSEYIEFSEILPGPEQFCEKLARLHKDSVSPTGKFGFEVTTCNGMTPQATQGWDGSWGVVFTRLLVGMLGRDREFNGVWEALDGLEKRFVEGVVTRLVGALEEEGRKIKPCVIHGDLWEGNTATSRTTGNIYVFDAGSYYAHNEMEIALWRGPYNKIHNPIYTRIYLKYYPPAAPVEEWDDRNRMYSVYYNILYSVNFGGEGKAVRQMAFDDMYFLIDKYAPFGEGEGPARLKDEERVELSAERDHSVV